VNSRGSSGGKFERTGARTITLRESFNRIPAAAFAGLPRDRIEKRAAESLREEDRIGEGGGRACEKSNLRNVASLPCFDAPAFNWRAEFLRRVSVEIVEEEETEEEGGGEREREREREKKDL